VRKKASLFVSSKQNNAASNKSKLLK